MTRARPEPPPAEPAWAFFLDLDGTLIELADRPDAVHLDAALLTLLGALQKACGGALALVSGRALADLERRLGGLRLALAGQHGLERRDARGQLWQQAAAPPATDALKAALAPQLARHPGLLLEDKGLSLALHYRQAPALAAQAQRLMRRLAAAAGPGLELLHGKCVVELRPAGCDKGTALAACLAEAPFRSRRPVFIGDDLTDEAGFAYVNRHAGVSIKVGSGPSCARYRLADVAAVRRWLAIALKGQS